MAVFVVGEFVVNLKVAVSVCSSIFEGIAFGERHLTCSKNAVIVIRL